MAFKIQSANSIGKRLSDIICYQLNKTMMEIRLKEMSVGDIIHDMRRRFKKIRSILKLIEDIVGKEIYARENKEFRDMARTFNQIRDAEVLLETFVSICQMHGSDFRVKAFESIFTFLQDHYKQAINTVLEQNQAMERVYKELEKASDRFKSLKFDARSWLTIAAGIKKTYENGRVRLNQARALASMTRIHEWRKQVRCLGFQLKLLRSLHPDLNTLFKDLSRLGALLGTHHDLAVLGQTILKNSTVIKETQAIHMLLELIETTINQLEKEAFILGNKIFSMKAKHFEKKLITLCVKEK